MVAKDWYEKPQFNWFLKNNRCIPMDRYGLDTAWLRHAREALKSGQSVIIYPEGRTGKALLQKDILVRFRKKSSPFWAKILFAGEILHFCYNFSIKVKDF